MQWRMQSLAAGTDFCAPEMQTQTISVLDFKVNTDTLAQPHPHIHTQYNNLHKTVNFTSQS